MLQMARAALAFLTLVVMSLSVHAQTCPGRREPDEKIVGGTRAKPSHWPAQVALRFRDPTRPQSFYFCGGTAIAPSWILTAAHCMTGIKNAPDGSYISTGSGLNDWRFEVVLGAADLDVVTSAQVFQVKSVAVRDGYTRAESGNDIALVQLSTPWKGPVAR